MAVGSGEAGFSARKLVWRTKVAALLTEKLERRECAAREGAETLSFVHVFAFSLSTAQRGGCPRFATLTMGAFLGRRSSSARMRICTQGRGTLRPCSHELIVTFDMPSAFASARTL